MMYSDACAAVRDILSKREDKMLKATSLKYILTSAIAKPLPSNMHAEREAALHVRKMIAEGEITEQMILKRLYYKLPENLA